MSRLAEEHSTGFAASSYCLKTTLGSTDGFGGLDTSAPPQLTMPTASAILTATIQVLQYARRIRGD
jgi:hypothetical protein